MDAHIDVLLNKRVNVVKAGPSIELQQMSTMRFKHF